MFYFTSLLLLKIHGAKTFDTSFKMSNVEFTKDLEGCFFCFQARDKFLGIVSFLEIALSKPDTYGIVKNFSDVNGMNASDEKMLYEEHCRTL